MDFEIGRILENLESHDVVVRKQAILRAHKIGNYELYMALQRIADEDPECELRYYAKKCMHYMKVNFSIEFTPAAVIEADVSNEESVKKLLKSDSVDIKKYALKACVQRGYIGLTGFLLELAGIERNPFLKSAIISAAGRIAGSEHADDFIAFIHDSDARVRANTVEALMYIGSEKAFESILPLLEDNDHRTRANAVLALKGYGRVNVLKTVDKMIESGMMNMQAAALYALTFFGEQSVPYLEKLMNSKSKDIKSRAVKQLMYIALEFPSAQNALERIKDYKSYLHGANDFEHYRDDVEKMMKESAQLIGAKGEKSIYQDLTTDKIASDLRSDSKEKRLSALQQIINKADRSFLGRVLEMYQKEKIAAVRVKIIEVIGKIGTEREVPVLKKMLSSSNAKIRAAAVGAVMRFGGSAAVEYIIPLLNDESSKVRGIVAVEIGRMEPMKALQVFEEMAGGNHQQKRMAVFGVVGAGNFNLCPVLEKLCMDSEEDVRKAAREALIMFWQQGSEDARNICENYNLANADAGVTAAVKKDNNEMSAPAPAKKVKPQKEKKASNKKEKPKIIGAKKKRSFLARAALFFFLMAVLAGGGWYWYAKIAKPAQKAMVDKYYGQYLSKHVDALKPHLKKIPYLSNYISLDTKSKTAARKPPQRKPRPRPQPVKETEEVKVIAPVDLTPVLSTEEVALAAKKAEEERQRAEEMARLKRELEEREKEIVRLKRQKEEEERIQLAQAEMVRREEEERIRIEEERKKRMGPPVDRAQCEPQMVFVDSGYTVRGTDSKKYSADEQPARKLFLSRFFISQTCITNAQYKEFCDETGYEYPKSAFDTKYTVFNSDGSISHESGKKPVVNVSFTDAENYCKWLSRKSGKDYRLPTEAEWEKACRGNEGRQLPWGNMPVTRENCNYDREWEGASTLADADAYSEYASPYGCYNMIGNVWEWCSDWYHAEYFSESRADKDPLGPESGNAKVLKGGSWFFSAEILHATLREKYEPGYKYHDIGFRVVHSW